MARLAVTVAVFLFLCASSLARTSLNLPANEVIDRELPSSWPEAGTKPSILLPSDSLVEPSESDVAQSYPQITDQNPAQVETESDPVRTGPHQPEFDTRTAELIPLTIFPFRPVNRHFRPYPFHLRRRGCRQGMKPRVSYGDDMMLAGENWNLQPTAVIDGENRMPERWIRFHHHQHHHHHEEGQRFPFTHHHEERPRFPFEHHHDMFEKQKSFGSVSFGDEEEREGKKGREEREDGGLFKGFRKFLNQFDF